jgi:predicted PurR-regulated permease PerM
VPPHRQGRRRSALATPRRALYKSTATVKSHEPLEDRLSVPPRPVEHRVLALGAFALFAGVILATVGRILLPYAAPILLAGMIVSVTHQRYLRLCARLKQRRELAAAVMLLGITTLVIVPMALMALLLIEQASSLVAALRDVDLHELNSDPRVLRVLELVQRYIPGVSAAAVNPQRLLLGAVRGLPGLVATSGGRLLGGVANVALGFLAMLLMTFYFYTEGDRLTAELSSLSPLPASSNREIAATFRDVVDSTFRGQLVTSASQGAAAAVGFWITGVPSPLFWGVVASLFALVPLVGPAIVWVPATAFLFFRADHGGPMWRPVVLLVWSLVVVSLIDNVVRPLVMRGGTRLSAVVLFFAIIGGLQAFGFIGLLLGPLVFALLVTVLHLYKRLVLGRAGLLPDKRAPGG